MPGIVPIVVLFAVLAGPGQAQGITLAFDGAEGVSGTVIQLFVLVTVLSIVPGLAIMITCFPFLVTVLSILRQAIGLQQAPPNMLIVSLALFLTYFIMDPVLTEAWETAGAPFSAGEMELAKAAEAAVVPFRGFMLRRVDADTLNAIWTLRGQVAELPDAEPPLAVLVPSFLLSEISHAFQIGFLIFLPFLIIDIVVAAVLMSMGMMMVPPSVVSLPFKLAFFVVADGWTLISQALVKGYF